MAKLSVVAYVLGTFQAAPSASELPPLRIVVRVAIAALIVAFLTYIVIEQVGSWRRRRSGRE